MIDIDIDKLERLTGLVALHISTKCQRRVRMLVGEHAGRAGTAFATITLAAEAAPIVEAGGKHYIHAAKLLAVNVDGVTSITYYVTPDEVADMDASRVVMSA